MTHGDFKDWNSRTAALKVLHNKTFNIAQNIKYDGYHCVLASMVYNSFDEKASSKAVKNEFLFKQRFSRSVTKISY